MVIRVIKFMRKKRKICKFVFLICIFIIVILNFNLSFVISQSAQEIYPPRYYGSLNPQFYPPGSLNKVYPGDYRDALDKTNCNENDFVLEVVPEGCSPLIIRSDLLEEQNVPVYCKVRAVQTNPFAGPSSIKSIRFEGGNPPGISGISYFPAKSVLKGSTKNVEEIDEDLGYIVITVARNSVEANMPNVIEGRLTAVIDYETEVKGVGKTNFYAVVMSDEEWKVNYKNNRVWNGKAYLRLDSVEANKAVISVYEDFDKKITSIVLKKGETSKDISLKGNPCDYLFNIELENINSVPVDSALIQVNNKEVWVGKEDRILDDKCKITNLENKDENFKVSVSCPVSEGVFDLGLEPKNAKFNVGGNIKEYKVGSKISQEVYLSYVGYDEGSYVVLIRDSLSNNEIEFKNNGAKSVIEKFALDGIYNLKNVERELINQYKIRFPNTAIKLIDEKIDVEVIREGEAGFGIFLEETSILKNKDWAIEDLTEQESLALEYYENAIDSYEKLVEYFPNELDENKEEYSAQALYESAKLSKKFEQNKAAYDFYNRIIDNFAGTASADMARNEVELLIKYDTSNSKGSVNINNEPYSLDIIDYKDSKIEEVSVILSIDGKQEEFKLNQEKTIKDIKIILKTIKSDSVSIEYIKEGKSVFKTLDFNKNNVDIEGLNVGLIKININRQVKLKINPKIHGPQTNSLFYFKVSIEKRLIKLSPEMARYMAENLRNAIREWEEVSETIYNVLKGLKSACISISNMVTIKNMIADFNGELSFRKLIMGNAGGWNEYCEKKVSDKEYLSFEKCLTDNNDKIEKDLEVYVWENKKIEDIIKDIRNSNDDEEKIEELFKNEFDEFCKNAKGNLKISGGSVVSFEGENSICSWDLTHEERKQIMVFYNIKSKGGEVLEDMVEGELEGVVRVIKDRKDGVDAVKDAEKNDKTYDLGIKITSPAGDKVTSSYIREINVGDSNHDIYKNFNARENIIRIIIPYRKSGSQKVFEAHPDVAGKEIIVQVQKMSNGEYFVKGKVYYLDGMEVKGDALNSVLDYISLAGLDRIKKAEKGVYENKIINPNDLLVKYFSEGPFKGHPSEIPFDVENGWYVEVAYSSSGFGKPYENDKAINYYICNVGPNGLIEFKKSADDICRLYNNQINSNLDFPGLSETDSVNLVRKAEKSISEAIRQKNSNKISISGRTFSKGSSYSGEEGRCTDFMSPMDCLILFNVCDPVICPPSRCYLGGSYRVDNVVQSGIIGSILLCLPNYQEGVMIPVCLTGIWAGIDGYISILKSTADCLEESVSSGRNIGICDQIKSFYLCEFFVKQITPFLEAYTSRMGSLYAFGYGTGIGQGFGFEDSYRGGAEYLGAASMISSSENSASNYVSNIQSSSQSIFQSGSLTELGNHFCLNYNSIAFGPGFTDSEGSSSSGGGAGFFDKLIEPESPPQFHGFFSERSFSTSPPLTHYKVYYHVYAGRNKGASFSVSLKGPGLSDYSVDSGYVAVGGQVDKSKDFTAQPGYVQLCLNVNGQEECGFGMASTSFAINGLTDMYIVDQITQNITSEKECISGTPSAIGLNKDIYKMGIIRVCSSENPGKQVDSDNINSSSSYDKWKMVGYCDDPLIKCWLDSDSVKDAIHGESIERDTLEEINLEILGEHDYLTEEESISIINEAKELVSSLTINEKDNRANVDGKIKSVVDKLSKLTEIGFNNNYRAYGFFLLGRLYGHVAQGILTNKILDSIEILDSDEVFESEVSLIENIRESTNEGIEEEHKMNCVIDAFWADKNRKKIPLEEKVEPGRIYFAFKLSREDCRGEVIFHKNNPIGDEKIEFDIRSLERKRINNEMEGDYYLYIYEIGDIGIMRSGEYSFEIIDFEEQTRVKGYKIYAEGKGLIERIIIG